MESARIIIEVTAGLIPGRDPDPAYTRRYGVTSDEWENASDKSVLLAERNGTALGYAGALMAMPERLNWVRVDWIWL